MSAEILTGVLADALKVLVKDAVREVLAEQGTAHPSSALQLAAEEMTTAEVLQLTKWRQVKTLWKYRRDFGFPAPRRHGSRNRYLRSEVDAWLAARKVVDLRRGEPVAPAAVNRRRTQAG